MTAKKRPRTVGSFKLEHWRKLKNKSLAEAAALVGSTAVSWHEWEKGQKVPVAKSMLAIEALTEGEVTLQHWLAEAKGKAAA